MGKIIPDKETVATANRYPMAFALVLVSLIAGYLLHNTNQQAEDWKKAYEEERDRADKLQTEIYIRQGIIRETSAAYDSIVRSGTENKLQKNLKK